MLKTLILKEYKYYLYSPIGFIFALLLIGVSSFMFFADFFVVGQASMSGLFSNLFYLLTLFIPAITMGSLADEQKNGTWELLLTSSMSETKLILGKFFGLLLVAITYILMTLPLALIVIILGKPDIGLIVSGYLGLFLITGVYVAIGVFASSLTSSAMIAFLVSSVTLLVLNLVSQYQISSRFPTTIVPIVESLSFVKYLDEFVSGVIRLPSLTIIAGMCVVFLALGVSNLKSRNA